jgi:hypothetical protein
VTELLYRALKHAASLLVAMVAAGCAAPQSVEHGFGFDARWDSPGIEVLDFRYGRSSDLATMARPPGNTDMKVAQQTGTYGRLPRPDRLYVRWKLRSTGEEFEDTVDLDRRLPVDIKTHEVYFVIKRQQLCVYLVHKEVLPPGAPPSPMRLYPRRVVDIVYPDAPTKSICQ